MIDLINIVIPKVMNSWEYIAYALRYDIPTVTAIKEKECGNPRRCCEEFFKDWLTTKHGTGSRTWSTLLDVLKGINDIADNTIEEITEEVKKLKQI